MRREALIIFLSGILLGLAIIILPNQFLFSKTVPKSFWTEYFPLPFGAGWFITFIVLVPVIWLNKSVRSFVQGSLLGSALSILASVPISLSIIGGSLSVNNLSGQYIWVCGIFVPPCLLHFILRCFSIWIKKKANRVTGGFSPPVPTPPGMRVRTGRFTKITGP